MPDINKSYSWAINTCNANNVGYSQTYRNQQTVRGITYYDCSSFINYALLAGGWSTPAYAPAHNAFTTYTEPDVLLSLGFQEVDPSSEYLAGDIGWRTGHTEMCYTGGNGSGVFMGAHTDNLPLQQQVSISNYTSKWTRLFRYGSGATGYGISIYVACALAGNAWSESHINPTLNQLGGTAFGLFQWDGERKTNLLNWLSENGYDKNSPDGQMKYLVVENDWIPIYGEFSTLEEFLKSDSTNIPYLTECFMRCWERPGVPALENRINFAQKAFIYIQNHANDTSIVSWETVPAYYLTEEQALRNAVLLYRFYSAGGGGGGTVTNPKKKMPTWMWIRYHY